MLITLVTKAGAAAAIRPIANRTPLKRDEKCRVEIEGASKLFVYMSELIGRLFAEGASLYLVRSNYPANEDPPSSAIASSRGASLHSIGGSHEQVVQTFYACQKFSYGEFCIFASRLTPQALQTEFVSMKTLDVLSVLSNIELQIYAMVGMDVESDTCTIASVEEALVWRVIEEALK